MQLHPQFVLAARSCLPMLPGVFAFGAVSGIAMVSAGMPHHLAMLMSVMVYAGSAQLAALQLVSSGTPIVIIILAGLVINLRLSIYSLSIAPHLAGAPNGWRPLLSYLLTDNSYAMSMRGLVGSQDSVGKIWYYLGCAAAIWTTWQIGTLTGIVLGGRIPVNWHLEFSIVLTFLGIVVPTIRDRPVAVAACFAGITAVLAWPLPLRLGLLVAAGAGVAAGMIAERVLEEARQ